MYKKLYLLLIFSELKAIKAFNRQISYAQHICNIRKISEHMQVGSRQFRLWIRKCTKKRPTKPIV